MSEYTKKRIKKKEKILTYMLPETLQSHIARQLMEYEDIVWIKYNIHNRETCEAAWDVYLYEVGLIMEKLNLEERSLSEYIMSILRSWNRHCLVDALAEKNMWSFEFDKVKY